MASRSPRDGRALARLRDRLAGLDREPVLAAVVAVAAGLAVFAVARGVFPYHSSNHDEAVYLQQAAMLLEGQLSLYAGELTRAFRPWFFVEDGGRLYPKYSPVPAAMYAVSMALFGEPRVTLAVVAAGNAALVYHLGSLVVDRRVGVVAAAVFAASPLALVTSAVFLPYAPTTLLNLLFAVAYLRGVRHGSLRMAGLAGLAVGLAFFARPYTALLFALPFVGHAAWVVLRTVRAAGVWPVADPVRRHGLTAALGLCFVGVTLAYNAHMTGSPLVFPYEAFAPLDGPGFGERRILGHSVDYTPELALEANRYVLQYFATRWFTAGLLGTGCAAVGVALGLRHLGGRLRGVAGHAVGAVGRTDGGPGASRLPFDTTATAALAGLFVTVPLGNVAFWGNYNVLGAMSDPTDGLVAQFGPIYHFDLLAPLSVFAAAALVAGWRWGRAVVRARFPDASARALRVAGVACLTLTLLVGGTATATLAAEPIDRNAAYTEKYERAYEPVEEADFEDALVFIPTPYGDWQNHPFQPLRNDPGFDGPAVYAMEGDPEADFTVLDAYPDRTYYRYTYRGEWTANPDLHVTPTLEPLDVRRGESMSAETAVGVPPRVDRATVRLEANGEYTSYAVTDPDDRITVDWALADDRARLAGVDGNESVPLDGTDEVVLLVTLTQPDGSTLTYRQEATVRTTGGEVEVVWPPERTVCPLVTDCGREGTYLPDRPDVHRDGVVFETRLEGE